MGQGGEGGGKAVQKGKEEKEEEDKEEGGHMNHKSGKIAAITMNVDAQCNPCQGIRQQCVIHELSLALCSSSEKCHFNTPTNPLPLCKQAPVLPFSDTSG